MTFSILVENEKCSEGHKSKFHLQYFKQEKIRIPFCKKANLKKFDTLADFFSNFHGKLELVKVKNVHLEVTASGGQFYQEAQIIF